MNDKVIVEELFDDITKQVISLGNQDFINLYMREYLLKEYLFKDEYRDHIIKNYDDKIFFFEPINKFYDMLWLKRLAFKTFVHHRNSFIG